jgi:hypothetical protein
VGQVQWTRDHRQSIADLPVSNLILKLYVFSTCL